MKTETYVARLERYTSSASFVYTCGGYTLEEKTVLNDYATTTKTVHNDSFSVVFKSLWTVLVVVA
jgi:hypothetical protein